MSQVVDELVHDRALPIQATQPADRPFAEFQSVPEVLRAFRDAIELRRSLFLDGNILHGVV
jgi:hypothetical protein